MKLKRLPLLTGLVLVGLCRVQSFGLITPLSDYLVVLDPAGNEVVRASESEPNENGLVTVPSFTVPGLDQTLNVDLLGSPTVLLDPNGQVSDIFGINRPGNVGLVLAFVSDGEAGLLTPQLDVQGIPENSPNGRYSATIYLAPDLQDLGYTAWFFSDSDPAPDSGSSALLLTLTASTLALARRKLS